MYCINMIINNINLIYNNLEFKEEFILNFIIVNEFLIVFKDIFLNMVFI